MPYEDPRYSELQVGDECMLFRDWASVCFNQDRSQQVQIRGTPGELPDAPIATLLPWLRARENNRLEWITAVSNYPLPKKVLREKQPDVLDEEPILLQNAGVWTLSTPAQAPGRRQRLRQREPSKLMLQDCERDTFRCFHALVVY